MYVTGSSVKPRAAVMSAVAWHATATTYCVLCLDSGSRSSRAELFNPRLVAAAAVWKLDLYEAMRRSILVSAWDSV